VTVEFAPGDLRAPAEVVDWVVERSAAPPPAALAGTSALPGGALHPSLEQARRVIGEPLTELWLERGDRRGRGWVAAGGSVLLHPLPDGRLRLVSVPSGLIVDALVRLNDVGPRPRAEPAVRIALTAGALAEALAARDASRAGLSDPDQRAALDRLVRGLREHWRVAAAWTPADGAVGGRQLEILDTESGYWLIVPDDPTIELWPTTPTAVFRGLCGLFPTDKEMRT
jgi:hypothetical protein